MASSTSPEPLSRAPSFGRVVLATTAVFLTWATLGVLARSVNILFLLFLTVLVAAVLRYPIDLLARVMPRPLAAALTFFGVVGLLVGMVWLSAPIVAEQAERLIQRIPAGIEQLERAWQRIASGFGGAGGGAGGASLADTLRQHAGQGIGALVNRVLPIAVGTVTGAATGVVLLITAIFLAYEPRAYVQGILRLIPRGDTPAIAELFDRLGGAIRHWMAGTLFLMVAVGAATAVGLLLVGVDSWFVLALLMFFGEFIPYVGPVLAAIPGVIVGLTLPGSTAIWVVVVYVAVQQLENTLLQPVVMKRAIQLQPALLIGWQLLLGATFGLLAVIVATPLLACLKIAVGFFWVERTLGKAGTSSPSPSPSS